MALVLCLGAIVGVIEPRAGFVLIAVLLLLGLYP